MALNKRFYEGIKTAGVGGSVLPSRSAPFAR